MPEIAPPGSAGNVVVQVPAGSAAVPVRSRPRQPQQPAQQQQGPQPRFYQLPTPGAVLMPWVAQAGADGQQPVQEDRGEKRRYSLEPFIRKAVQYRPINRRWREGMDRDAEFARQRQRQESLRQAVAVMADHMDELGHPLAAFVRHMAEPPREILPPAGVHTFEDRVIHAYAFPPSRGGRQEDRPGTWHVAVDPNQWRGRLVEHWRAMHPDHPPESDPPVEVSVRRDAPPTKPGGHYRSLHLTATLPRSQALALLGNARDMPDVVVHRHRYTYTGVGNPPTVQEVREYRRGPHSYASTQLNLEEAGYSRTHGSPVPQLQLLARKIDGADLAEHGRESDLHVTTLYGLHGSDPRAVADLVRGFGTVPVTFGDVTVFPAKETDAQRGGDEYDVVKVDVDSPELRRLNKLLATLPHASTHPRYSPHITLAYVKPGLGKKYAGPSGLKGQTVHFTHLVFSDQGDRRFRIPLFHPDWRGVNGTLVREARRGASRRYNHEAFWSAMSAVPQDSETDADKLAAGGKLGDQGPALVYADWLEERGHPLGTLIRHHIAENGWPPPITDTEPHRRTGTPPGTQWWSVRDADRSYMGETKPFVHATVALPGHRTMTVFAHVPPEFAESLRGDIPPIGGAPVEVGGRLGDRPIREARDPRRERARRAFAYLSSPNRRLRGNYFRAVDNGAVGMSRRGTLRRYSASHEEFHASIRAHPLDPNPHLVYADWLDENGDRHLADVIRGAVAQGKVVGGKQWQAISYHQGHARWLREHGRGEQVWTFDPGSRVFHADVFDAPGRQLGYKGKIPEGESVDDHIRAALERGHTVYRWPVEEPHGLSGGRDYVNVRTGERMLRSRRGSVRRYASHEEFHRAIAAAGTDPHPTDVYADWLQEQGNPFGDYLKDAIRHRRYWAWHDDAAAEPSGLMVGPAFHTQPDAIYQGHELSVWSRQHGMPHDAIGIVAEPTFVPPQPVSGRDAERFPITYPEGKGRVFHLAYMPFKRALGLAKLLPPEQRTWWVASVVGARRRGRDVQPPPPREPIPFARRGVRRYNKEAFIGKIREYPTDPNPHRVYADWLDEQADTERADRHRLIADQLAAAPPGELGREIAQALGPSGSDLVLAGGRLWRFRSHARGSVSHLELEPVGGGGTRRVAADNRSPRAKAVIHRLQQWIAKRWRETVGVGDPYGGGDVYPLSDEETRLIRLPTVRREHRHGSLRRYAASHEEFVGAIRANPGDPNPADVYADWLQEQGHPLGGEIKAGLAHARHLEARGDHAAALLARKAATNVRLDRVDGQVVPTLPDVQHGYHQLAWQETPRQPGYQEWFLTHRPERYAEGPFHEVHLFVTRGEGHGENAYTHYRARLTPEEFRMVQGQVEGRRHSRRYNYDTHSWDTVPLTEPREYRRGSPRRYAANDPFELTMPAGTAEEVARGEAAGLGRPADKRADQIRAILAMLHRSDPGLVARAAAGDKAAAVMVGAVFSGKTLRNLKVKPQELAGHLAAYAPRPAPAPTAPSPTPTPAPSIQRPQRPAYGWLRTAGGLQRVEVTDPALAGDIRVQGGRITGRGQMSASVRATNVFKVQAGDKVYHIRVNDPETVRRLTNAKAAGTEVTGLGSRMVPKRPGLAPPTGKVRVLQRAGAVRRYNHEAFHKAMAVSPQDQNPVLTYADWLEERGDPFGTELRKQVHKISDYYARNPQGYDRPGAPQLRLWLTGDDLARRWTDTPEINSDSPTVHPHFKGPWHRMLKYLNYIVQPWETRLGHGEHEFPLFARALARAAVETGDTSRLPELGAFWRESGHPHAELYDWANVPAALSRDLAVHQAVKGVVDAARARQLRVFGGPDMERALAEASTAVTPGGVPSQLGTRSLAASRRAVGNHPELIAASLFRLRPMRPAYGLNDNEDIGTLPVLMRPEQLPPDAVEVPHALAPRSGLPNSARYDERPPAGRSRRYAMQSDPTVPGGGRVPPPPSPRPAVPPEPPPLGPPWVKKLDWWPIAARPSDIGPDTVAQAVHRHLAPWKDRLAAVRAAPEPTNPLSRAVHRLGVARRTGAILDDLKAHLASREGALALLKAVPGVPAAKVLDRAHRFHAELTAMARGGPTRFGRRGTVRRYSLAEHIKAIAEDGGVATEPHLHMADILGEQGKVFAEEVVRRALATGNRGLVNLAERGPSVGRSPSGLPFYNIGKAVMFPRTYYGTHLKSYGPEIVRGDQFHSSDLWAVTHDKPYMRTVFGARRRAYEPGGIHIHYWPAVPEGVDLTMPVWKSGEGYDRHHPVLYVASYPLGEANRLTAKMPDDIRPNFEAYLRRHGLRRFRQYAREADPRPELAAVGKSLMADRRKSPDYGCVFYRPETGEVWYVSADGDDRDITDRAKEELGDVPGVKKVTVEAESYPPKGAGWEWLFPPSKKGRYARGGQVRRYALTPADIHPDFHPDGIAPRLGRHLLRLAGEGGTEGAFANAILTNAGRPHEPLDHNIIREYASWIDEQRGDANSPAEAARWREIPKGLAVDRIVQRHLAERQLEPSRVATLIPIHRQSPDAHTRAQLRPLQPGILLASVRAAVPGATRHDIFRSVVRLAGNTHFQLVSQIARGDMLDAVMGRMGESRSQIDAHRLKLAGVPEPHDVHRYGR